MCSKGYFTYAARGRKSQAAKTLKFDSLGFQWPLFLMSYRYICILKKDFMVVVLFYVIPLFSLSLDYKLIELKKERFSLITLVFLIQ